MSLCFGKIFDYRSTIADLSVGLSIFVDFCQIDTGISDVIFVLTHLSFVVNMLNILCSVVYGFSQFLI